MSMIKRKALEYTDGRTKQSFKDATDINKLLRRAQINGGLSHLSMHGAMYGDFSDVPELLEAHGRLQRGEKIYRALPSELRREFPSMFEFFAYVNDPVNKDRLPELFPELAAPGRQVPAVRRSAATESNPAVVSTPPEAPPEAAAEPEAAPAISST